MITSRRSLFGLLAGAVVVGAASKVAEATPAPTIVTGLDLSDGADHGMITYIADPSHTHSISLFEVPLHTHGGNWL